MEKTELTAIEILQMIIKDEKYYTKCNPQYKASTAFRIVAAIKAGTCKPETEKRFFAAFGYQQSSMVKYLKS